MNNFGIINIINTIILVFIHWKINQWTWTESARFDQLYTLMTGCMYFLKSYNKSAFKSGLKHSGFMHCHVFAKIIMFYWL